jgi:hypothetical protein
MQGSSRAGGQRPVRRQRGVDRKAQASTILQTAHQRHAHRRAGGPDATAGHRAVDVAEQAQRALGDHLRGRAVAGVAVAGDGGAHHPPIARAADEQQLVAPLFALLRVRPAAGLWQHESTEHPAQRTDAEHRVLQPGRACHAARVPFVARQHALVVDEVLAPGVAAQGIGAVHVLGVDRGHHERPGPGLRQLVPGGAVAIGLRAAR